MPRRSVSTLPTRPRPPITGVAQEIERLGSLAYQKNLPSFNCATAKRQVEKAICADPGLAQLDRNINDVFLRVIASAESDSHRAALALTRQQRDFIVMAGLVPAIHVFFVRKKDVDARDKPGHDARMRRTTGSAP
jgi:hypothetical protein